MKKSYTKAMLGSVGAGVIMLCMAASSWSMPHSDEPGRNPERMLARMEKKLDLTAPQKEAVVALLTPSQEQSDADREKLDTLRETLHKQHADFDAGSAQQIADEIGKITSRMVFRMASTQAEIYQLLSVDQREKMDAMMKKREERGGKRRGSRRGLF